MKKESLKLEVKDFLINKELSMLQAMEQLDRVSKKVLFVVEEKKLVGSITDGDIRRWILKKGNLDAQVQDIANYNPKYLYEDDKSKAKDYMRENFIEGLPILNEERKIVSIVLLNEEEYGLKHNLNIPVVIMAGGKGTRLYPYTKILPKPLIPIGEIPIVEHIMNKFNQYDVNSFFLIVNHKKNMIKAYFNEVHKNYEINFIDEEKTLGTGGGLSLLKNKIKTTFILSNCDILIEADYKKMLDHHRKEKNLITMVCSIKKIKIPYGVVELSETGEIQMMKEKPELSFFTNTGMYIVEPLIIDQIEVDKAIDFPDIISNYKNNGWKVGVYPIGEKNWLDMGEFDEMEKMQKRLEYEK